MGSNWQPINSKEANILPVPFEDVLICFKSRGSDEQQVCVGWYESPGIWEGYSPYDYDRSVATHWMPLPEAPAQQEVDNGK